MAKSIRSYVCTGCGIGECLNAQKLAEVSAAEFDVEAQVHPPLCVPEGVDFLRKDIEAAGADHVVIAACSDRVNWDVFSLESLGVNAVQRVNIREQVAWSKPPNDEETQMLAEDYLRMGIVRAQKTETPPAKAEPAERTLLVVGGGVTGITAAIEAAEAGSDVVLVEKGDALGGWLAKFYKSYPTRPPYRDLEDIDIEAKVRRVQQNPRITVLTSAEVESISGRPGSFDASIRQSGSQVPVKAGGSRTGYRLGAAQPVPARTPGLRQPSQRDLQCCYGRAGETGGACPAFGWQVGPERSFHPKSGCR